MKNVFRKLLRINHDSQSEKETRITFSNANIVGNIVHQNDHVNIISKACSICYGKEVNNTREKKLEYIGKRIKSGHESILEHSNVVMYFIIPNNKIYLDLAELLTHCKYLNTKLKTRGDKTHLIVAGSIRGFKHIIRNVDNYDNPFVKEIIDLLYELPKEYFYDFIQDKIMLENNFKNIVNVIKSKGLITTTLKDNQLVTMLPEATTNLNPIGVFSTAELLDVYTLTFLFEGMSRYTSHQLVRHRNAITQASQRYIDYSNTKFNNPCLYKNYNDDIKTRIQAIATYCIDEYKKLRDDNVDKQDARAILPEGVQTSLYMTFTISNLIKFLQLRTHSSAQDEIRMYAKAIEDIVQSGIEEKLGTNMYNVLIPKYKMEFNNDDYSDIDEVVDVVEEDIDVEDDSKLEEMVNKSEELNDQELEDISDLINKFIVDDEEIDLSDTTNFE